MRDAYKHFTSKDSTKEESQIKDLFVKDIGYAPLAIYINGNLSNLKDDLNEDSKKKKNIFLQNSVFDIEETIISSYKDCCVDGGNQSNGELLGSVTNEKAKIFCEAVARRVYKIRNYIVHTKKGERSNVFVPKTQNFVILEKDLNLIEYIASYLLLKMIDE